MKRIVKIAGVILVELWEAIGFIFCGKEFLLRRYTKEELDEMGINFDYE